MSKVLLIAAITFRECLRSKALYGILLFGILLFAANMVVTPMFSWELGKVAVDLGLSAVSLSGLLIIFFFSMHMVSTDLERKSVYMVLSRPITRAQYILGKYVGLGFLIGMSCAVLGVCSVVSVKIATIGAEGYIPSSFSWSTFLVGLAFLTLSLLVMMALTLLWVMVTTHPFTAVLLSILSYFIGQNMESVKNIITSSQMFTHNAPLNKVVEIVTWIFPNLAVFDLKTTAAYGLPTDAYYLLWVALYGVSYCGACLAITVVLFQRRELA